MSTIPILYAIYPPSAAVVVFLFLATRQYAGRVTGSCTPDSGSFDAGHDSRSLELKGHAFFSPMSSLIPAVKVEAALRQIACHH